MSSLWEQSGPHAPVHFEADVTDPGARTRRRIVVVDDEKAAVAPWLDELTEQFEVVYFDDASQALDALPGLVREGFDLLVCDLMMPTGPGMSPDRTSSGTRTGLLVYDVFREALPRLPVIVLSNVRDDKLFARLREDPATRAARKRHLLPDALAKWVNEMIRE